MIKFLVHLSILMLIAVIIGCAFIVGGIFWLFNFKEKTFHKGARIVTNLLHVQLFFDWGDYIDENW